MSFCFPPTEGAKSFGVGGIPLPGHHAGSTPSNGLLSSKAHDVSALVLHQDHWYIYTLQKTLAKSLSDLFKLTRNRSFVAFDEDSSSCTMRTCMT